MSKQIKQYRYYGEGSNLNYPSGLNKNLLIAGSIFQTQIADLHIQSYPGTQFYLNDSTESIMIGASGEYHLGLSGNYEISSLRFEQSSFKNFDNKNFDPPYLIVDIIYNTTEE